MAGALSKQIEQVEQKNDSTQSEVMSNSLYQWTGHKTDS